MIAFRAIALATLLLAAAMPDIATAQQGGAAAAKPADAKVEAPPEPPPPAYEKEVLRLSEIIGSLSFLRGLCTAGDAAEWPRRMQALLDSEGSTTNRRDRLAGAYNRGYRGFSVTYRACTPSAREAMDRYLQEGDRLSRLLAMRYGG